MNRDELVQELRKPNLSALTPEERFIKLNLILLKAAKEIERLTAENSRLREAAQAVLDGPLRVSSHGETKGLIDALSTADDEQHPNIGSEFDYDDIVGHVTTGDVRRDLGQEILDGLNELKSRSTDIKDRSDDE